MINANELRIGNYVYYKKENPETIFRIVGIVNDETDSEGKVNGVYEFYDAFYDIEYILPIPLTPELLEKAGFRKASYYVAAYSREGWGIDVNDEGDHYELFINDEAGYLLGKINYLHQLQNAFFALTGKELTITL
jgi:hypothetical protein